MLFWKGRRIVSTRLTSLPSTRFLLSICFHAVFYFFLNVILYRQALRSAGVSQECFLIMDYEAPALKAAKVFGFAIRGMIFSAASSMLKFWQAAAFIWSRMSTWELIAAGYVSSVLIPLWLSEYLLSIHSDCKFHFRWFRRVRSLTFLPRGLWEASELLSCPVPSHHPAHEVRMSLK